MARRSAEDTRRVILDTALRLLLERGPSAGVQHIRLQEVLRSVGLTTGAAYRIWNDQDHFHRELATEMVLLRFAPPTESAVVATEGADTFEEVIRLACADHVRYVSVFHTDPGSRRSHAFLTALALRTAAGAWPELRDASMKRHSDSIDQFTAFYTSMLDRFSMRMRPPLSVRDFAEAMASIGEGFAVRAAEGLEHPVFIDEDDPERREWTLMGITVRELVRGMTEFVEK